MPCPEFEERLLDYPDLELEAERHAAGCPSCAAFVQTLAEADAAIGAHLAGVRPSAAFRARIMLRTEPYPTAVPELLDFLGWAGLLAAGVGLVWIFAPFQSLL